jgi:hypothetical protein
VTGTEFARWLDELQDEWVHAARRLSPRLVAGLLAWAGPQITATFRRQDPQTRTASSSWAGPAPYPAWLNQARELLEYRIHRQQILQAPARPSDLCAGLAAPVLDELRWPWPFRLGPLRVEPGDTVTIAIDGPGSRTRHLMAARQG